MSKQRKAKRQGEQDAPVSESPPPKTVIARNSSQVEALEKSKSNDIIFLIGAAGTGKAQPLYSRVYKKDGPSTIGELAIGDEIATEDGSFTKVTGIFPQGEKQINRVHFRNGSYVDCCDEHLWKVSNSNERGEVKILKTSEIETILNKPYKHKKRRLSIDCCKAVEYPKTTLPLDSYVLGVLISEGCLKCGNVFFSTVEKEILERVTANVPEGTFVKQIDKVSHRITNGAGKKNTAKRLLTELGLYDKYSYEKFIPDCYKYASIEDRVALLQGLMDGDGTVSKEGLISYNTTSPQLAKDVAELVNSLGGICSIRLKRGSKKPDSEERYRTSYNVSINLTGYDIFFLARKKSRVQPRTKYFAKYYIDRIEKLGTTEMQCISVEHESRLYLTDNYIVTHNTFSAMQIAWEMLKFGKVESIVITRPIVPCGGRDKMGFQPGDLKAKFMNYVMPFRDVLNDIVGSKASPQILDSFEWLPLDFVRGRTLKNCVAIMDEAQNAEEDELRAFLTRIGPNGKLILCGHPKQCDLRCGGQHFIEIANELDKAKTAAVVHFNDAVNERHPLIPKIEKVFDARADKRRKQMQQV